MALCRRQVVLRKIWTNGFGYGGWAMQFGDSVLDQVIGEMMSGEFDLLLGRRTYEIFAGYWPHAGENAIAKAFNKATKYVATRTLERLDWKNSVRVGGDAAEAVPKLKASNGPELHVWGSGKLLQSLIAADLIDEYRMWVCPVVLGEGTRLFENNIPPRSLALIAARTTSTGVLLNTYRPAGSLSKV